MGVPGLHRSSNHRDVQSRCINSRSSLPFLPSRQRCPSSNFRSASSQAEAVPRAEDSLSAERQRTRSANTPHQAESPHFTIFSPQQRGTTRHHAVPRGASARTKRRTGARRLGAHAVATPQLPRMRVRGERGTGCALGLITTVQRALRRRTTKSSAMRVIEERDHRRSAPLLSTTRALSHRTTNSRRSPRRQPLERPCF